MYLQFIMISFQQAYQSISPQIQTIILISIVAVIGIRLGKIKFFNVSLGMTFVFFIGIVVGHFDLVEDASILIFAQDAGLILFVYALGMQVGPGFFSSFGRRGLGLNILAFVVIVLGIFITVLFGFVFDIPFSNMVGIMCGAVTNTPALGAAQQALSSSFPDTPASELADMALATAITYPLGVVGVIIAIIVIKSTLVPKSMHGKKDDEMNDETFVGEFIIANLGIEGKTIKELMWLSSKKFIISRIRKDDIVQLAKSDTTLSMNDELMVICKKSDLASITALLGKMKDKDWNNKNIDWNHIDNSHLISKRVVISQDDLNGKKLGSLRLRNTYRVNLTRVERIGMNLLATPDLTLQMGDVVTVVGERSEIEKVVAILGNSVKQLNNPNLIPIFLGIFLGLLLGSIPLYIPGVSVPVRLGIAGGPIIVGILMGASGSRFRITTYSTPSSNLFMREFGIVIYLACLGISSGSNFFETVLTYNGILWIGLGFVITFVPLILTGYFALKVKKIDYGTSVGMMCGAMANPIALNYANSEIDSDKPSISYTTVYPMSIFMRIITAQFLILFFC